MKTTTIDHAFPSLSATTEASSAVRRPILEKLRAYVEALREGAAMSRRYEALRSNGVPHSQAIERVFGSGSIGA
ncbi:MAG TPA: hypothetical protein PK264_10440 [Hyphomicrobiaceae bacterium]|nr:hypothetical protein [Hyphomicrobiaceae bacterium]